MALAAIQDILTDWPGWTPQFELQFRHELSGQADGLILVKDLGPALWKMTAQSTSLSAAVHRYWKARLVSLEDGAGLFYGYDFAGCYPIAYPRGSWSLDSPPFDGLTARIYSLDDDDATVVSIEGLPSLFQFSTGDYFSIPARAALHQVMENAVADVDGVTPEFVVRPAIRTGAAVGDLISVKHPAAVMMVIPGSVSAPADPQSGRGTVSFQAIQVIS